jgi:hypothetical protein
MNCLNTKNVNKEGQTLSSRSFCSAFDVYMARVLQMVHIRPQHNHHRHSGICPTALTLVSRRCRYRRHGLSSSQSPVRLAVGRPVISFSLDGLRTFVADDTISGSKGHSVQHMTPIYSALVYYKPWCTVGQMLKCQRTSDVYHLLPKHLVYIIPNKGLLITVYITLFLKTSLRLLPTTGQASYMVTFSSLPKSYVHNVTCSHTLNLKM